MNQAKAGLNYALMFALLCFIVVPYSCDKLEEPENESDLVIIADYDGNNYHTKKIGDQWWMVNNLKTTHYADGTAIPLVESNSIWEALAYDQKAYCFYNNDEGNAYGALYTWAACMNDHESVDGNPSEVQGVCPDGWHIPSDTEWKELEMYLGMSQATADISGLRGANEGSKLATSANLWLDGYLENDAEFGASGFTVQPGGGRRYDGSFDHMGDNANFWTATEDDYFRAWGRHIYSSYTSIHRYKNVKSDGFSVRCVKDE